MFNSIQDQMGQFREQAASTGFGGTAILDVHPDVGIIRLKLNTVPPEALGQFTEGFSQMMVMMLGGVNITVKKNISREAK